MNTKLLMTASALILGVTGVGLVFLPQEIQSLVHASPSAADALILQLLGGLYFAFAMINWTSRANLIGGIYGRPIAIGNLTHFSIGALSMIKGYSAFGGPVGLVVTIVYALFAIMYGIVFFTHPAAAKSTEA
jgi:hypothetical protein